MYVFVTIGELTGKEKQVALGDLDDKTPLRDVFNQCMGRIDTYLPERDRADARHFWHNDHLVPFERNFLSDVAAAANITLELRPDHYHVELPKQATERYAINPELAVAQVIDSLMGQTEAWKCYDLLPRGQ